MFFNKIISFFSEQYILKRAKKIIAFAHFMRYSIHIKPKRGRNILCYQREKCSATVWLILQRAYSTE